MMFLYNELCGCFFVLYGTILSVSLVWFCHIHCSMIVNVERNVAFDLWKSIYIINKHTIRWPNLFGLLSTKKKKILTKICISNFNKWSQYKDILFICIYSCGDVFFIFWLFFLPGVCGYVQPCTTLLVPFHTQNIRTLNSLN